MLRGIADRRIRRQIADRIDGLTSDPEKQGKPLRGELSEYRSLRAAGQRYRVLYSVEKDRLIVAVVAIGIRREGSREDVYVLAKKLLRLRLIEPR